MNGRTALALIIASLATGCGGALPFLGSVAILPQRVALLEGDTTELHISNVDDDEAEWVAVDTAVVRVVGPAGRIAAVAPGRTTVMATTPDGEVLRAYVFVSRALLVGAGDIAVCGYEADEETARLLDSSSGVIWTAGDNAYPSGTRINFEECFDPTWGRHKDRIRPTPGNHEYRSPGAAPYFEYFGDAAGEAGKGWYSYRYGGWLVIALNSNLTHLSDELVEEQMAWLRETLEENPARCSLAYFHHPLFSSGRHGGNRAENVRPFYEALYEAGADVVLVGHDHHYERFPRLNPAGEPDPAGIRQFLVGTGGGSLRAEGSQIHPHSQVFYNETHGILELVLHADSYDWQFVSVEGTGRDSGSDRCH